MVATNQPPPAAILLHTLDDDNQKRWNLGSQLSNDQLTDVVARAGARGGLSFHEILTTITDSFDSGSWF